MIPPRAAVAHRAAAAPTVLEPFRLADGRGEPRWPTRVEVAWDEERQIDLAVRYWERARRAALPVDPDFGAFWRDFEWMGVQRQLKVLGIFARLAHRDGKHGYLADMPRVMAYLRGACGRYSALAPLLALLDRLEGRDAKAGYTF